MEKELFNQNDPGQPLSNNKSVGVTSCKLYVFFFSFTLTLRYEIYVQATSSWRVLDSKEEDKPCGETDADYYYDDDRAFYKPSFDFPSIQKYIS